jgi:hypothetical protein
MSGTKSGDLATIRIGTRVRHSSDSVAGRIVWDNAVAVKIQWDDGERVTWKRAELRTKGLEVVEADEPARSPDADDGPMVEMSQSATESVAADASEGNCTFRKKLTSSYQPDEPADDGA